MNAKIEIVTLLKMHLAYVTQIGEKGIEMSFQKIVKWAIPKGLLERSHTHICRVFHDSFKNTDADKVRMSIGILSNDEIMVDGEIESTILEAGKTIVGHFVIDMQEFETAWNSLFLWMNENGYKKSERNPFEMYHNNHAEHPEKKCIFDLCIPIE